MSDSKKRFKILLVDDELAILNFYKKLFEYNDFEVQCASDFQAFKTLIENEIFDIVLLDLQLGSQDGLQGIDLILRDNPGTRIYILTAHGSVDRAVEAMRKGAAGFFEKGNDPASVLDEIKKACAQDKTTVGELDLSKVGLIGKSHALQDVLDKVQRLRGVESTVLLLGESGTGKEVIARAIHRSSNRAQSRFLAINCGAIPEALLESELFGHKRGAFTDAKADRKGIFELCSSGTLLMDEIGDMPLSLQTKLLRVLQEREITPIGGSETIKINTRMIAATHRDIMKAAAEKKFREDLYYRLSIIVIHIPSLRERSDDIPLLVNHFLNVFNQKFDRDIKPPTPSVMANLVSYKWPGNIRELQNALERAVVLSRDDQLNLEDLFAPTSHSMSSLLEKQISSPDEAIKFDSSNLFEEEFSKLPLTQAKQAFERRYLEYQLKKCRGNVMDVAEKTGRYRADIYRLLTRYGLDHMEFRSL